MQGFLKANHKKECAKEILLEQIKKEEDSVHTTLLNALSNENSQPQHYKKELTYKIDNIQSCQENKIKKHLKEWFIKNKSTKQNKNHKRLIFVLICKAAPFLDDSLVEVLSLYLKLNIKILQYYVSLCSVEYMENNKHILEVKQRRDKYFIKMLFSEKMLKEEGISEYDESLLKISKAYNIKKYKNACAFLNTGIKSISNRAISKITGISRSIIDRLLSDTNNLLKDLKSIKNNSQVEKDYRIFDKSL